MVFGYVGQAVPFSSSSNLSPLAPPFTVDPSHPGPRTNSFGQLTETWYTEKLPYNFGGQHENWQLPSPSVPNSFSGSKAHHASGPPSGNAAAYDTLNPDFFVSQSVSKSYSTSAGFNVRGVSSLESAGDPLVPGSGLWSGMSGGEQWRREDTNLVAPPTYNSLLGQGILTDEFPAYEERPGVWPGMSVDSFPRKAQIGSRGTDFLMSKSSSTSDESTDAIPFNMSKTSKVPYPQTPPPDLLGELWSQINPTTNTSGRHLTGLGPYASDALSFYPSTAYTTIHSYDPSSHGSGSTSYMKAAFSSNVNLIEKPRASYDNKEDSAGHTPSKPTCIQLCPQQLGNDIEGYNHAFQEPSTIQKDGLTNSSPVTDAYMNHLLKEKDKPQHTLSLKPISSTTGGDPNETSSEVLDQLNLGVDSPCWRGASGSRHALFGVTDSVTQPQVNKMERCNGLFVQEHQTFPINREVVAVSSPDDNTDFMSGEMGSKLDGSSPFLKGPPSYIGFPSVDNSKNDIRAGPGCSKVSDNIESGSDFDVSKVCGNLESCTVTAKHLGPNGRVVDREMDLGSSYIPDHSRVLVATVPCSGGSLPTDLAEPLPGASDTLSVSQLPGIGVQLLVQTMHNLSELLLSCCSKDVNALKEQDHVVIQNILNNLDACVPTKVRSMEPMPHLQKENGADVGIQATKVNNVQSPGDFLKTYNGERNSTSIKKEIELLDSSPHDDKGFEKDDHMTQAIKKILEENFHNEHDSHPQILLFKNLWLETEAALCAMKYKARFTDVKIKMESHKQHQPKGNFFDGEQLQHSEASLNSEVNDIVASKPKDDGVASKPMEIIKSPTTQGTIQSSGESHGEDVDSSVMARFNILKSRVENKEMQQLGSRDVGVSLPREVTECNLFNGSTQDVSAMLPQQLKVVDLDFPKRRSPWPFVRVALEDKLLDNTTEVEDIALNLTQGAKNLDECASTEAEHSNFLKAFSESISDDPLTESLTTVNLPGNELQAGGSSSSSSDWEHILKESAWQT